MAQAEDVAKNIPIPGTDLQIHGTLREVPEAPLVVLSHCLTGDRNALKYYTAARVLSDSGFSSYRFDYYSSGEDARNLVDCTIQDHVHDLDLVIRTLKSEQPDRPITVIGHSLGGLVILLSQEMAFDFAVFWDGTHTSYWDEKSAFEDTFTVWEPGINLYRLRWGVDVLVSREFLESYRLLDCDALMRKFDKPVLIVAAGAGALVPLQKRYYEAAPGPKQYVEIDGADHNFAAGETLAELINVTRNWLRQPTA